MNTVTYTEEITEVIYDPAYPAVDTEALRNEAKNETCAFIHAVYTGGESFHRRFGFLPFDLLHPVIQGRLVDDFLAHTTDATAPDEMLWHSLIVSAANDLSEFVRGGNS